MVYSYFLSNGNMPLAEHFALSEFQCKNGTDEIWVSDILVNYLEQLRTVLNADSIIINSGYRTPDYSVSVGGSAEDPHTKGLAADIFAYRNEELISGAEMCCAAQKVGFGGIGYMGNAIHVDVRNEEEYFNNHWWGNEQNGDNVYDWYDYFGIERPVEEVPIDAPEDVIEDAVAEVVEEPITDEPVDDIDYLAQAVIRGDYGNGQERVEKLGDMYGVVQARVDEILSEDSTEPAPEVEEFDVDEYAMRTIRGEFGNGQERVEALGDKYDIVQKRVNEILKED